MNCPFCKSKNLIISFDVGFDIYAEGEEKQHLQVCKDCDANRFIIDQILYDEHGSKRHYSKWRREKARL